MTRRGTTGTIVVVLLATLASRAAGQTKPPADTRLQAEIRFMERLAELAPGDDAGTVALAAWAAEHDLFDLADELYREVLARDLDNEEAFGAIWHLGGTRALPRESDAYRAARAALPESFRETETRRFVIVSDADDRWVRARGRQLEQTYDRFIRFANRLGMRPLPLRHKLVAIAFDDVEPFVAFSTDDGNTLGEQIAGYYSPAEDRLVFYHVESNRNVARARDRLASMETEMEELRRSARRNRTTGRADEAEAARERLREQQLRHQDELARLESLARRWSTSVVVHEAVHHLMFHTGVQARTAVQPVWLSEGLATAFETDDTAAAFGPGHEYEPRRDGFWNLLDGGRLLPLRRLVTMHPASVGEDPASARIAYDQSYALVSWMCRHRELELRDYVRRINALPPREASPERFLEIFEAEFGEIDRVERAWLRYEQ